MKSTSISHPLRFTLFSTSPYPLRGGFWTHPSADADSFSFAGSPIHFTTQAPSVTRFARATSRTAVLGQARFSTVHCTVVHVPCPCVAPLLTSRREAFGCGQGHLISQLALTPSPTRGEGFWLRHRKAPSGREHAGGQHGALSNRRGRCRHGRLREHAWPE